MIYSGLPPLITAPLCLLLLMTAQLVTSVQAQPITASRPFEQSAQGQGRVIDKKPR